MEKAAAKEKVQISLTKRIEKFLLAEKKKVDEECRKTKAEWRRRLKEIKERPGNHPADENSDGTESLRKKVENCEKRIKKFDEALLRLSVGLYGICSCGKNIPIARLNAVPLTNKCLECKEKDSTRAIKKRLGF